MPKLLNFLWALSFACASFAQTSTVQIRVYGGQQDDRGRRVVQLSDGDVLILSTTNSTDDGTPHAWLHRMDSTADLVWSTTIEDEPLLQPMDAVEHGDGLITVLGMRFGGVAQAYDWGWYTLNSEGDFLAETHWGTDSWDLPVRTMLRNDTLWSVGTSYSNGTGAPWVTAHVWVDDSWSLVHEGAAGATGEELNVVDAAFLGEQLLILSTVIEGSRVHWMAVNPLTDESIWTYESGWADATTAVALDVQGESAVALMNVETEAGMRLAFAVVDLSGVISLEHLPGSGVSVAGCDVQWYSDLDFATVASTEELGLGGDEILFSRWSAATGAWQGGPTFGTPWDEIPAAMLCDEDGRLWIAGATDGYSNGRDDLYVLQIPDAGISDYQGDVVTDIVETLLQVPFEASPMTASVFPNPTNGPFQLHGFAESAVWHVYDTRGSLVLRGQGSTGSLLGMTPGLYFLHLHDLERTASVCLPVRLN